MKIYIVVKLQFEAIHHWPECDIDFVKFLRYPHRHIFYVVIKKRVYHDNRQIEFIDFKNKVDGFIQKNWNKKTLPGMSCEMMAEKLMITFKADFVSVFEDNENGAEVISE